MEPVSETRLRDVLARANIRAMDPAAGVGRELTYGNHAPRLIVIHFAETDPSDYCIDVLSRILEADDEWLLITRYGAINDLGLTPAGDDAEALAFAAGERRALATYLCNRSTHLGSISADVYVLSVQGHVLITWDHHSADEGITVSLQSISDAGRILASLNELGVELELFYAP